MVDIIKVSLRVAKVPIFSYSTLARVKRKCREISYNLSESSQRLSDENDGGFDLADATPLIVKEKSESEIVGL